MRLFDGYNACTYGVLLTETSSHGYIIICPGYDIIYNILYCNKIDNLNIG